jgi:5'-nucleotidase/UDP-sugar diphosphatase
MLALCRRRWLAGLALGALLALGAGACSGRRARPAAGGPLALTILHTNDHHGHLWRAEHTTGNRGGLAARAALITRIRADVEGRGGHVLLLDAGDLHTGTFCADELKGELDVTLYGRLGYRAMALGNHEFDLPLDLLRQQAGRAAFPFLGANVVGAQDGKPIFGDAASWDLGGARVTALGLTLPSTPEISTRGNDPRLRFLDPAAVAAARVPSLRREARVLIGLYHLGHEEIDAVLARAPGVDLVVSGHDHQILRQPRMVGAVPVVEAGSGGQFLGRVDLVAPAGGTVALRASRLYDMAAELHEDPAIARALAEGRAACGGEATAGHATAAMSRLAPLGGPGSSTAIANLVADAFRAATGAQLAFVNRGGIRTDLPAGVITRERVHEILPFDDTLVVFEADAAELAELAAEIGRRLPDGQGLLFPSGGEVVVGADGGAEVRINGRPVARGARVTVAVSDFIARGGDGYRIFGRLARVRKVATSPEAALLAYLAAHDPVTPSTDARLRLEGPAPAGVK